jgi:hypothetical protein
MRRTETMLLIILVTLLAGCADSGESDDRSVEEAASPTPTRDDDLESTDPVEPELSEPEGDPIDLLFQLDEASTNQDMAFIYRHLVERFRLIDFESFHPGGSVIRLEMAEHFADDTIDHDSFSIEDHESFVVVRYDRLPQFSWVFRAEDGEWRYDPGVDEFVAAFHASLPETQRGDHPWNIQTETLNDFEGSGEIFPLNFQSVRTVAMRDDSVELTVDWSAQPMSISGEPGNRLMDHLRHDVIMPLESIQWHAGEESGPVEVIWTDAMLSDDELRLPGWGDLDLEEAPGGQSDTLPPVSNQATFRLDGVPGGVDEIILQTNDLQMGPFGEDSPVGADEPINIMLETYIPAETSSDILLGEALVEQDDTDVDDAPTPVPQDDVPAGPDLADQLDLLDVEYERESEDLEAIVRFSHEDVRFEPVGPESSASWSDGEESEITFEFADELEIRSERSDVPPDAEIESITLRDVAWQFDDRADGVFHEDRIETKWGGFPIQNIVEESDGSAVVHYLPAGRRYIRTLQIEHEGERIVTGSASNSFDQEFVPGPGTLNTSPEFEGARDDLPLPVTVEIWQAEGETSIDVEHEESAIPESAPTSVPPPTPPDEGEPSPDRSPESSSGESQPSNIHDMTPTFFDVAQGPDGEFYLTYRRSMVMVLSPEGEPVEIWDDELDSPGRLTVDSRGNVTVADCRVRQFNRDGEYMGFLRTGEFLRGELLGAYDLATGPDDSIFMSQNNEPHLTVFQPDGDVRHEIPEARTSEGGQGSIIDFDERGRMSLLALDHERGAFIEVRNDSDEVLHQWELEEYTDQETNETITASMMAVAPDGRVVTLMPLVDEGSVEPRSGVLPKVRDYVVQVYSESGDLEDSWLAIEDTDLEEPLWMPAQFTIDEDGILMLPDGGPNSHRIQRFGLEGEFLGEWGQEIPDWLCESGNASPQIECD